MKRLKRWVASDAGYVTLVMVGAVLIFLICFSFIFVEMIETLNTQ